MLKVASAQDIPLMCGLRRDNLHSLTSQRTTLPWYQSSPIKLQRVITLISSNKKQIYDDKINNWYVYAKNYYPNINCPTDLGFHAGSTTITRSALVSVRPSPPTCDVNKKIGAPGPSWKS